MKARHWIVAALCVGATALNAHAGDNAGGYLVFYTNDATVYCTDTDYTHLSGVTCEEAPNPVDPCPGGSIDCSAQKASVQNGATSGLTSTNVIFWLLAGWPEETCPKLKAVIFGIQYDETKFSITGSGTDADFELTTPKNGHDWPASGAGTALTWNSPRNSHLKEIYWFTGYVYDQQTNFTIVNHPTQGFPKFGDANVPAGEDEIGVGYDPAHPSNSFLPSLGLAGAAGNNGDITPVQHVSWGTVKSRYQR
ncbi:MAG: hypothetical protein U0527_13170 [Candidatus Eisenbacteria bacterium]